MRQIAIARLCKVSNGDGNLSTSKSQPRFQDEVDNVHEVVPMNDDVYAYGNHDITNIGASTSHDTTTTIASTSYDVTNIGTSNSHDITNIDTQSDITIEHLSVLQHEGHDQMQVETSNSSLQEEELVVQGQNTRSSKDD